ncbi:anti-sigma factor family protein [Nocardioides dongkuii]|uniref:anti-sigma factor family protein n=1 Tax=Nocardioides dongkuii TaxID=2760089 RepID=UPI0015FDE746|nr:zf-HC2 domain-containing protein [Nocardioides dongkuii]
MIGGHLGSRTSALLDGQLSAEETERAWAHVHHCHQCRDLVEREGWVKTRLAGLDRSDTAAPPGLKGSLLGSCGVRGPAMPAMTPGDAYLALPSSSGRSRRTAGLVAIGGGAVGAAVMGVLALGTAPADAPSIERRAPVTSISGSGTPTPTPGPARASSGSIRQR